MKKTSLFSFELTEPVSGLVSVIVPCYNQAPYLAECLQSVLDQHYTDWECIIMDDGSSDGSAGIAKEFCKKDTRFRYYAQRNAGVAVARNQAISKSRGEFILPLDGDDRISPPYLFQAVELFGKDKALKLVYCQAAFFGAVQRKWDLPKFGMKAMLRDNIIFCTALFRRSDFIQTGGYKPEMKFGWEDWDFWLTLLEDGARVARLEGTWFHYRIRQESRNNSLSDEHAALMLNLLYQNHRELFDSHRIHPLEEWKKRKKGSPRFGLKHVLGIFKPAKE